MDLIIAILVIAVIALVVERQWSSRKKEDTSTQPTLEAQPGYTSKISGSFTDLRNRVLPGKQDLSKEFQTWAAAALTEQKALQAWLTSFSAEEAQSFTAQLAAFCTDLNLDLGWLVQQQLSKDPEVEQAAKTIVIDYCQACYHAAQAQAEFKAFAMFQSIMQNPKAYHALSQKLFTQLVNQKLTTPITPDLFLAAEDKRQAHVIDAIRQAAEKDRKKFIAVLRQVLADEAAAEGTKSSSWMAKITKPFQKSEPVEEAKPASTATA